MSDPPPERRYSSDEVGSILRRAIEKQAAPGALSHQDLLDTAREIGVSPDALEQAIEDEAVDRAVKTELEARQKKNIRSFRASVATYVVMSAFFVALNLLTTHVLWFPWMLLAWGFIVAMQGVGAYFPKPSKKVEKQERKRIKEEIRAAKRRAEGAPIERGARVFGEALRDAFGSLLENAGEGLREIAEDLTGKKRPASDASGTEPGPRVRVPPSPGGRVAPDVELDEEEEELAQRRQGAKGKKI